MTRRRTIPTIGLAVAAALALLAAVVLAYVARAAFNADQFADRASAALSDEAVADEVAVRVADELVEADPNLVAVRPVIESVTSSLIRGGAFQSLFRAGVADMHRSVFEGDQDTLTLTLVDIGATVRGVLQALQPNLAKQIPASKSVELVDGDLPAPVADLVRLAEAIRWLPIVALASRSLCAYGAVRLAGDGRDAVLVVGVAITLIAVLASVALRGAEALVLHRHRRPGRAATRSPGSGTRSSAISEPRCSCSRSAAGWSRRRRPRCCGPSTFALRSSGPGSWRPGSPSTEAGARCGRSLLVAAGILIVLRNQAFLSLLATLVGVFVAYAGVAELMRLTIAVPEEAARDQRRGRSALRRRGDRRGRDPRRGSDLHRRGRDLRASRSPSRPRAATGPSALRPLVRRGRDAGHAQLDVRGVEPRLALRPAGEGHPRSAARRDPRAPDRRALRRRDPGRDDQDRPLGPRPRRARDLRGGARRRTR